MQDALDYLPDPVISCVAESLDISYAQVRSTRDFYAFLFAENRGRYRVLFSDNITDRMLGSQALFERIDLSYTAAYKLGIIQNGSARVEVEAILPGSEGYKNHVAPLRPVARINTPIAETQELSLASGVYLQLGAFSSADNADNLKRHLNGELNWLDRPMHIIKTDTLHRVQLGPFASRAAAEPVAERIRSVFHDNRKCVLSLMLQADPD